MTKCHICGSRDFTRGCNRCGQRVCSEHRLPENHQCSGLSKQFVFDAEGCPDSNPDGSLKRDAPTSSLTTSSQSEDGSILATVMSFILAPFLLLWVILTSKRGLAIVVLTAAVLIGIYEPAAFSGVVAGSGELVSGAMNATNEEASHPNEATADITPNYVDSEPTSADGEDKWNSGEVQYGLNLTATERLVHKFVNLERKKHGLGNISYDSELSEIAVEHSKHMSTEAYFSHTAPNGTGPTDRYSRHGYNCRIELGDGRYITGGSENIAQTWYNTPIDTDDSMETYTTERELARGIVTQWMKSPGHRENILREFWQNEGIGVSVTTERGKTKVYATQNFC